MAAATTTVGAFVACTPQASNPQTPSSISTRSTAGETPNALPTGPGGSAIAALDGIRVAGRGPRTGYLRKQFGQGWLDTDRNGCDTRNDILRRDLTDLQVKPGTRDCVIASGRLFDPYTRQDIAFVRGGVSEVEIDHVVALGNAWVTGASGWDYSRKSAFANDPLNLLAVSRSANRQKGDGDAATWLPNNKSYRCDYVARQVAVKKKFGLYVTSPERDAMNRVLQDCPNQPLPTGGNPVTSPLREPAPTSA